MAMDADLVVSLRQQGTATHASSPDHGSRSLRGLPVSRLFDFDRAISTKSGLRPAVCGCSGIVSVGPSSLDCGTRSRCA